MPLSNLKIAVPHRNRIIDPTEIFSGLTLRGSIENIWFPQAEALQKWHEKRTSSDVIIEMSTGGGKTLVGLLLGQSLVNETQGRTLYVCHTNQLVEQTAERAHECGLDVAMYMGGRWTNEQIYLRSLGLCITNYAALFNGRSIFRTHDLRAVIFDDAHVAQSAIRSQYSIVLGTKHEAFTKVAGLFRSYFTRNHRQQEFEQALQGDRFSLLFVPMFEVYRQSDRINQILEEHGISENGTNGFAWQHVQAHLQRCVVLISGGGIEITPPVLPLRSLPWFGNSTRRVYMTATLPSCADFVRTFGIGNAERIVPGGKSGEAQRQILFLTEETDAEQREQAQLLIATRKACIITPSKETAKGWCPPATLFDTSQGNAGIQEFAKSTESCKLALAGRFDGIDLPGNACRILVLDELPQAASLFEQFMDQKLRVERLRATITGTRLVQAIGRIFRSNTDHGVVIICSNSLQHWLSSPNNLAYLPKLLQRQVQLGFSLQENVKDGQAAFQELIEAVLNGDPEWDQIYREYIDAFDAKGISEVSWLGNLVAGESEAYHYLWEGNYQRAAENYSRIAQEAEAHDRILSAWYRHFEGLAQDLARNGTAAAIAYIEAANERAELGRPTTTQGIPTSSEDIQPSHQAMTIARLLQSKRAKIPSHIERIKTDLCYGENTALAEEALLTLGELLGLDASRPDKKERTGPDVLWRHPELREAVAIEAKTDKKPKTEYRKKDDIGQFHDHVVWTQKHYAEHSLRKVIVGPKLRVSADANPTDDLRIVTVESVQEEVARLEQFFNYVISTSANDNENTSTIAERGLRYYGLVWPDCVDALESTLAVDLQKEIAVSAGSDT